jgi:GH24 family phage-related lysozyme (muramidase)
MKISEKGLALIKRFEGCSLTAYRDCVGVWTIGYGTTSADKALTGRTIKRGLKISQATAERWLRKSIDSKYGPRVAKYNPHFQWSQDEFDALVSFAYNLGSIDKLVHESGDVTKRLRSRAEIAAAWCLYDKADGRHNKGLLERRKAELALFRTLTPSTSGNPYPEPLGTVCSTEQAAALGLQKWIPQGDMVKAVQWELCRLGYTIGKVDGICGKATTAAVIEFQRGLGLAVDGAVGPNTWAALTAAKDKPVAKSEPINYRERAAKAAAKIYPMAKGKKHGSGVQKRVKTLEQFKAQKELNCHLMVSLVLQEAGCLPKGCVITHTPKGGSKRKITDAVKGTEKLRHCKVYWVNKHYKDLPEKWRKAGVVYIQDSNACISAGGGWVWTCNKRVGEWYRVNGDYRKDHGYVKASKILCVIVPEEG